ncbi:uncharacterized protein LOC119579876 [Penaeus monodon]|uniref:uncharacterized protein LOC119579876 n=1 Tax=Penaeus monodon TaxID=6687 RepID=UPI0018A6F097|nr:uncharacterized protein LOC119579876 [Penaeus monodon]
MPEVKEPVDHVSADLMDSYQSYSGKRYVLSTVDNLSRAVQLVALPDKQAETVANAFVHEYVTLFGAPKMLVIENAKSLIISCSLKFARAIRYHITSFSVIRQMKYSTLKCGEEIRRVYQELKYALNSAVQRSVNAVPWYPFTGYNCNPPAGIIYRITKYDEGRTYDTLRKVQKAWKTAATYSQLARATEARYHD